MSACGHLGEALLAVGTEAEVRTIYRFLEDCAARKFMSAGGFCLDRLRGDYAFHLDLIDDAENWYQLGFDICTRERCPVELGRCHQGLAAVAERRGDMASAREHLDAAGELFSKHGAKLFLGQVLKKKEFLKA